MTILDDTQEGDVLSLEKTLTRPQLFRYSAITWNAHRIHYDREYARDEEGHPDVLVHQHLYGAIIQELLLDWLDGNGVLTELSWRNIGRSIPGQKLHTTAEVTAIDEGRETVTFDVAVTTEEATCVKGTATVRVSA